MPTPIIRSNPTMRSAEHKESKPHHPSRRLCRPLLGRSDVRLSVGDLGWTAEFPLGGDISPRRFPGAVERDSIFPRRPHFGNPHRNLRCRRRQRGGVLLCRGDFNANCYRGGDMQPRRARASGAPGLHVDLPHRSLDRALRPDRDGSSSSRKRSYPRRPPLEGRFTSPLKWR